MAVAALQDGVNLTGGTLIRKGVNVRNWPLLLFVVLSCVPLHKRQLHERGGAAAARRHAAYLKAHLRTGDAIVLSEWVVDTVARRIAGKGERYDMNRVVKQQGDISLSMDSVVLYETNDLTETALAPMAIMTAFSAVGTAICAANPKACFGSCPTVYVQDGNTWRLQAESFSSSVAPSLEASDTDALPDASPINGKVSLSLRNEAYETHNIRHARLLAFSRNEGESIFAGEDGRFWRSRAVTKPEKCTDSEGDCTASVSSPGGAERFSLTDSSDLAAREYIDIRFPASGRQQVGLVIKARQSLVSTFLFYQALAYMGTNASHWLAALERGDERTKRQAHEPTMALGGIDVEMKDERGEWRTVATTLEHGPIVSDTRVLPLPTTGSAPLHLRLRVSKGAWRIDHLALATLDEPAQPTVIDVSRVLRGHEEDAVALEALKRSDRFLTTRPGDMYTLEYSVPPSMRNPAFFFDARGYYLEWMREEWLAEESQLKAAMMLNTPALAMRVLAPAFKKLEPSMENAFWSSRYVPR